MYLSDLNRFLVLMPEKKFFLTLRVIVYTPGLWIMFLNRFGKFLASKTKKNKILKPLAIVYNFLYFLVMLLTGIYLPIETKIGEGLYIGHWGAIVVHPETIIGDNCNLSQGVTLGEGGRAKRGCPTIGDRVFIGPGAKIFGPITIGNDVAVGANAVVTKSLEDMAVVVGVPAKVISHRGSNDFVILE